MTTTTAHHDIAVSVAWADAAGTRSFCAYTRDYDLRFRGKHGVLPGSAPVWFRGHADRYNNGELFVSAIVSSHMLRFLEVASQVGLVVLEYDDEAVGVACLNSRGDGVIADVTLRPRLTVQRGPHASEAVVAKLHERAHSMSIVAQSLRFPVLVEPRELTVADVPEA